MDADTVFVESLGCAKNLVDSEVLLGCLRRAGFQISAAADAADVIIVNTCAFIDAACREAIDRVLRYARLKDAGSCRHLIVCGCLAQRYKDSLAAELPEVDLFLGAGEYANIARHIHNLRAGRLRRRVYAATPAFLLTSATPRLLSTAGASSYIKIAEGCSHRCTYCTIPAIKGPYRQRRAGSIVREAGRLARQGIGEINLVAQDTTRYEGLAGVLKQLCAIEGLRWIRLLYCHPRHLTHEILKRMAGEEKICRYLDMPLQHICDPLLTRMGRRTSRAQIERLIGSARNLCPDLALRTTFIVGFPGETDADFQALLDFARHVRFDHLGAFVFHAEEGTPASRLPGMVPAHVARERFVRLMRQQAVTARENNRRMKGRQMAVLVEGPAAKGRYAAQARSEFQAPEVDGVVYLTQPATIGSFQTVTITKTLTYDLVGELRPSVCDSTA